MMRHEWQLATLCGHSAIGYAGSLDCSNQRRYFCGDAGAVAAGVLGDLTAL
jgi:hypothetical protein